jgi:Mg2+ and Co2+ transporter CorA
MDTTTTQKKGTRKRSNQFLVRMTDEEYEKYTARLADSKMIRNTYNVRALNNATIISRTAEEIKILADIQKNLSALGNNINQLAKRCNENKSTPKLETLEKIQDEVNQLWQSLKLQKGGRR